MSNNGNVEWASVENDKSKQTILNKVVSLIWGVGALGGSLTVFVLIAAFIFMQVNDTDTVQAEIIDQLLGEPVPIPDLIAHYPLDGNGLDISGSTYHGTVYEAIPSINRFGEFSTTLEFDGVDDYLTVGNKVIPQFSTWSISLWVNTETNKNLQHIFTNHQPCSGSGQGMALNYWGSESRYGASLYFGDATNAIPYAINLSDGEWHHLVAILDGQTYRLYVDGVLVGEVTGNYISTNVALDFGRANPTDPECGDHAGSNFDGRMDDIRIYNYALSQETVTGLFEEVGPVQPALVAHYPLDGNGLDVSGNEHHGTVYGAIPSVNQFGEMTATLEFDGVDDYLTVGNEVIQDESFSVSLWINTDVEKNLQRIFTNYRPCSGTDTGFTINYWGPESSRGLGLHFGNANSSIDYDINLSDGEWHHIVGVVDNDLYKLYVDGLLAGQISEVYNPTDVPLDFGRANPTNPLCGDHLGSNFDGRMDDIRIYNYALEQSEITDLYEEEEPVQPALIAHYPLDGDGLDVSGNDHHGMVYGAIPSVNRFGEMTTTLEFDGINDYMTVGNEVITEAPWSIALWVNTEADKNVQHIFTNHQPCSNTATGVALNYWGSESRYGASLHFGNAANAISYDLNLSDGEWHHLVAMIENQMFKLYVDGVLVGEAMGDYIATDVDLDFGRADAINPLCGDHPDSNFEGQMDDIRIYNYALEESEVTELFEEDGPVQPALIAHYPLDGDGLDVSGNGHNATVYGTQPSLNQFGEFSTTLEFDGVDDYMTVGNEVIEESPFSISLWVNTEVDKNVQHIFTNHQPCSGSEKGMALNYWGSESRYGTSLHFGNAVNAVSYAINLSDDEWHHLAAITDGQMFKLYVDGALVGEVMGNYILTDVDLDFGRANPTNPLCDDHAGSNFDGRIDDIRIYNYALEESEVTELFEEEGPVPPALIAHYPLDGNGLDVSDNGHNATVYGTQPSLNRFGEMTTTLEFDGMDDYLTVSNEVIEESPFSISLWVNIDVDKNLQRIFTNYRPCSGSGTGITINYWGSESQRGSSIYLGNTLETVHHEMNLSDGEWHHLVATVDVDRFKLYIDGVYIGEAISPYLPTDVDLDFGRANPTNPLCGDHPGSNFDGRMDDIRIYNYVLEQVEVTELYEEDGPVQPALIAHYPLDGDGLDISGNNYDATVYEATPSVNRFGEFSTTLEFDGVDDYLTVSNDILTGSPWSISLWVNTDVDKNVQHIFTDHQPCSLSGKGMALNFWGYESRYGSSLVLGNTIETVQYEIYLADGEWHHLVATVDEEWFKLYVDGVFVGEMNSPYIPTDVDLDFGRANPTDPECGDHAGSNFDGRMDDIRIYNYALEESEVAELFEEEEPAPPSVVATFPLDGETEGNVTIYGAQPAADRFGEADSAYEFDGQDDYLTIGNEVIKDPPFSLALWVRTDSQKELQVITTNYGYCSGSQGGYILKYYDGGEENSSQLVLGNGTSSLLYNFDLSDGQWHHLVVAFSKTRAYLYVDGQDIGRLSGVYQKTATNVDFARATSIPADCAEYEESGFAGRIDDISVYNYVLSESDVMTLYQEAVSLYLPFIMK